MAIKALPIEVRNALRTGLVITSVSQCVSELIFNSLDAGSKSIAIRIDLIAHKIQVVDNGCGMNKNTLDLTGLRYMTSKCRSLEDLHHPLGKMGFRGEALASLRNVSGLLTIESRTTDSNETFSKVFHEGKALDAVISNTQRPSCGTTVTVQDFMYNMPVRRNRVRDALKLEEIISVIESTALTYHNVSFSLRNDVNGSMILQTHRTNDTLKTFGHLFGQEIAQTLVHLTHSSDNFKVFGYISNEAHFQRNLQFIYLNKRLIYKTKLHKLVSSLLLKSSIFRTNRWAETRKVKNVSNGKWLTFSPGPVREKFPVYILNITCAYTEYDASFDMKKTVLDFRNWNSILDCLQECVENFVTLNNFGLSDVIEENTANYSSADSSVLQEIENLAREQGLDAENCVLVDETQEPRFNDGTKTIRGSPAVRKRIRNAPACEPISPQKSTKNISMTKSNPLYPVCRKMPNTQEQIEEHYSSSNKNVKQVKECVTPTNQQENTLLSEDPFFYSELNNDSPTLIHGKSLALPKSHENKVIMNSCSSPESENNSCTKYVFSVPLFPTHESNPDYFSLRDMMRMGLIRTFKSLSNIQREKSALVKSRKLSSIKIIENKSKIDYGITKTSELTDKTTVKKSTATTDDNHHDFSAQPEHNNERQSQLFQFLPITKNIKENQVPKTQSQCTYSPYFKKPLLPKHTNKSSSATSTITKPIVVESPYFQRKARISSTQTIKNTIQKNKNNLVVNTDHTFNFVNKNNPTKIEMVLPKLMPSLEKISRTRSTTCNCDPTYDQKSCCSHGHHFFSDSEHSLYHNNDVTSTMNEQTFVPCTQTNLCSSCSVPINNPRCYLTTADLICKVERGIPEYCSPSFILNNDVKHCVRSPSTQRPRVTWGNVQFHSIEPYSSSVDSSAHTDEASNSFSSLSHDDPASYRWQPNRTPTANTLQLLSAASHFCQIKQRGLEISHGEAKAEDVQRFLSSTHHEWMLALNNQNHKLNNDIHHDLRGGNIESPNELFQSQANEQNPFLCTKTNIDHPPEENGASKSQLNAVDVRDAQNCSSTYVSHQSPPPIKFNQLFSSSSSRDDRNNSCSGSDELCNETLDIFVGSKRKQKPTFHCDCCKKKRGEEIVSEDYKLNPRDGHDLRKCLVEKGPRLTCTAPSVVSLDDSYSEEFLTQLHQTAFKSTPKQPSQGENPQKMEENLDDTEQTNKESNVDMIINIDEEVDYIDKEDSAINKPQEKSRSSEEIAKEDVMNGSLTQGWIKRLDAEGKMIFVHSRSGMTSFKPPTSDLSSFSMAQRYDFLPKGMSPILRERDGQILGSPTPGVLKSTREAVTAVTLAQDEISAVKWREGEELVKRWEEDAERRMAFCEPAVPSVVGQAGVYHLLNSYTFTKHIFTSIQVLGQLDKKFIVTLVNLQPKKRSPLLALFDQHAVDERIRLERLAEEYINMGRCSEFKTSPVDTPITVALTPHELRVVSSHEQEFQRIGLRFVVVGDTGLKVTSAPRCLDHVATLERSVEALVRGHVNALLSRGGVGPRIPNTLQVAINTEACRGAVKFGDSLSLEACEGLVRKLGECTLPFQCAHGRPSLVPIADIHQIQEQQQKQRKPRKVDMKPRYQDIKAFLGVF